MTSRVRPQKRKGVVEPRESSYSVTMCVNEMVDLVKTEDEVVVIGEATVFLPVFAVNYDANR